MTEFLFFAQPLALLFAATLPLLWLLFKLLPMKPRRVVFPAMVLFDRKKVDSPAPKDIPLWLKILRLLLVLCFILALAKPIYDPVRNAVSFKPTLILIDNSWSAAVGWQDRIETVERRLSAFVNLVNVPITIVTTAPDADTGKPVFGKDLSPDEAKKLVQSLKPEPWAVDYEATSYVIHPYLLEQRHEWNILWFSDGTAGKAQERLLESLSGFGDVTLYDDTRMNEGLVIQGVTVEGSLLTVTLQRRYDALLSSHKLVVLSNLGDAIVQKDFVIDRGHKTKAIEFSLPEDVISQIAQVRITPDAHAGTVWYVDKSWNIPRVGIWTDRSYSQKQDYLNDVFYIAQSLSLSAKVQTGSLQDLIDADNMSMIVLPDSTTPTNKEYEWLEQWINAGGSLVRFAGPNLAEERAVLLPVEIYGGGRSFGGAMTWDSPAKVGGIANSSPFAHTDVPQSFTVRQQVLARPSIDLNDKRWIWIEDQTPLVTHTKMGRGHSILIHTSADTSWSDLVISDFFPEMMSSLAQFSRGFSQRKDGDLILTPYKVFNGYGQLQSPGFMAETIKSNALEERAYAPNMPPGFYRSKQADRSSFGVAYNLGENKNIRESFAHQIDADFYDQTRAYNEKSYQDLSRLFFALTVILLVLDALFTASLVYGRKVFGLRAASVFALGVGLSLSLYSFPSFADESAGEVIVNRINLGYVITGDSARDQTSQKGLDRLGDVLRRRTTVEFHEAVGVRLGQDDLSEYPLLYWPMTPGQPKLIEEQSEAVQYYLDHGGMVLFDTRDGQFSETGSSLGQDTLRRVMQDIRVGSLAEIPNDHVLKRSYYLIEQFPGLYEGHPLWIENVGEADYDGVPSVIIGSHDWASAWANAAPTGFSIQRNLNNSLSSSNRAQTEQAVRFGVNLVMMSLTGNYKKDQVHVKYILERFGRDR